MNELNKVQSQEQEAFHHLKMTLEDGARELIENYCTGISAIKDAAMTAQKLNIHKTILSIVFSELVEIEKQRREVQGHPLMEQVIDASYRQVEAQITGLLVGSGVPESGAKLLCQNTLERELGPRVKEIVDNSTTPTKGKTRRKK